MKELVQEIIQALVDRPEEIELSEVEGDQSRVFELKVAKEDRGKVIGKKGQTADAIRTLLNATQHARNRRIHLEILE